MKQQIFDENQSITLINNFEIKIYIRLFLIIVTLQVFNCSTELFAQESKNKNNLSISDNIEHVYTEYIPNKDIGCSIFVAKGGEIIYQNAFGLANIEFDVPMQRNTILGIGSITKQFTAVSIIKLAEQGRISLTDKISMYIKDYSQGDRITIENLLRHTSGIKSFEKLEKFQGQVRKFIDYSPSEIIEEIKKEPLEFDPGSQWSYSNSGYFILGYIIEQITGKPYQKYLEENVFQPLGLKDTYYGSNNEIIKRKAVGYKIENNKILQANYLSMSLAYSVGAIFSTTSDLYNWYKKLFSKEIIKPETLSMMCQPTVLTTNKSCAYGLGFFIDEIQGAKAVGHSGGLNGYSASVLYFPTEKIFVAVLSNFEGPHAGILSKNIAALALGRPFKKLGIIKMDSATLNEYKGLYKMKKDVFLDITENGKQVFAQIAGNSFRLTPYAIDSFYIDGLDVSISFIRNKNHEIEKLVQSKTDGSSKTIWEKVSQIEVKAVITVNPEILKLYEGNYQLQEKTYITITTNSGKLFLQVTGQPQFELIPEANTTFKVKGIDAVIEFNKNAGEKADKLILFQFGKQFECKKINESIREN